MVCEYINLMNRGTECHNVCSVKVRNEITDIFNSICWSLMVFNGIAR